MRRTSQSTGAGGRRVGLLVLAACTAWLVVENTLLILAVMWKEPAVAGRLAMTVVKAGALVTARFWTSPAAAALVAVLLLILLMRARPGSPARSEARHG